MALNYHDSVDHLRGDLMKAYTHWGAVSADYLKQGAPQAGGDQAAAYGAALMASAYSYTLAAVLKSARRYGDSIAEDLAALADELLVNGDSDNVNADVMPERPTPSPS